MRRWVARAFGWAWSFVGLQWVPARGRLPLTLTLLYGAAVLSLWLSLPPRPNAWHAIPGYHILATLGTEDATTLGALWQHDSSDGLALTTWPAHPRGAPPPPLPAGGQEWCLRQPQLSPRGRYVGDWFVKHDGGATDFRIREVAGGAKVARLPASFATAMSGYGQPHLMTTPSVARFSPDEQVLALVRDEDPAGPAVLLWDLEARKPRVVLPGAGPPLAYNADGTLLATAYGPGGAQLRLWDAGSGRPVLTIDDPLSAAAGTESACCLAPAFAADGLTVARLGLYPVPGDAQAVWAGERRYDTRTGRLLGTGCGVCVHLGQALVGLTGRSVVVAEAGRARVLDGATGELLAEVTYSSHRGLRTETPLWGWPPYDHGGIVPSASHTVIGERDRGLVAVSERRTAEGAPWSTGWSWLDDRLATWLDVGVRDDWATTVYEARGRCSHLPGWQATGFLGGGRQVVTMSAEATTVAVWDLPLRPPWPLILGWAALPPGLVLAGMGLRRARRSPASAVAG